MRTAALEPTRMQQSYQECERLARRSRSNFFLAFQTLPREMYLQMCVLYAFMRKTDDLSDQPGVPLPERHLLLSRWRGDLQQALAGNEAADPILRAMADVADKREIPASHLFEVIDGVAGDLTPRTFETFSELEHYCYQVAGVVGLCCLKIWGCHTAGPHPAAIACGTAFQLTNILRDLREDAERGRLYLPREEMTAFDYSAEDLQAGAFTEAFRDLMAFQVKRAWTFYQQAFPLARELTPPGRRIFLAFFDVYSQLLREIEKARFDVLSQRIHLSRWKKTRVVLSCLLRLEPKMIPLPAPRITSDQNSLNVQES